MSASQEPRRTPYKGLVPYSPEDAAFFFGREKECQIIVANLFASRLTLVYGESGVGKSSILQAGVVRQLLDEAEESCAEDAHPDLLVSAFSSWRDDPQRGLSECIAHSVAAISPRHGFADEPVPTSLVATVEALAERTDGALLLLILDQFEEYFLYNPHEADAESFADELAQVINRQDLRVNCLLSIREDSLAKLDSFKGRIPHLFDNYLRIEHLETETARKAVVKPVERYNELYGTVAGDVDIEPELVAAVLEQVRAGRVVLGEAGRGTVKAREPRTVIETPYLQLVMTRLWDEERAQSSRTLRVATLERLGGAEPIVRTHLDSAMGALQEHERDAAAALFHHLVTPSGTKIAHTAADLADYTEMPAASLEPVLERLCGSGVRILRPVAPPLDQPETPRYQIFHDVLAVAILDWRRRYLYERERVAEAQRQEEERRRAESEARTQERARVATQLRWLRTALVLVTVLALGFLAFYALQERQRAHAAARAAVSRELAMASLNNLEADPELATLLALEAVSAPRAIGEEPPREAQDSLVRAMQKGRLRRSQVVHPAPVWGLAWSPAGQHLASGGFDAAVRLWDLASGQEVVRFTGHGGPIYDVAFSPDSRSLASASFDGSVKVWGITSEREEATFANSAWERLGAEVAEMATGDGPAIRVTAVAEGGPGSRAALAVGDRIIKLGDEEVRRLIELEERLERVAAHVATELVVERDGKLETLTLTVGLPQPAIWTVAWSPDGRFVAAGDGEGRVRVAEAGTGAPRWLRFAHTDAIWGLAWSPGGQRLVSTGWDGVVKVWRATDGQSVWRSEIRHGWLGVSFNEVPETLATELDLPAGQGTLIIAAPEEGAPAAAAGLREGDVLLTFAGEALSYGNLAASIRRQEAGAEVEIELLRDGVPLTVHCTLGDRPVAVNGAAWNPAGDRLATVDDLGLVRFWDAESGTELHQFAVHSDRAFRIAWRPDGRRLATTSRDGTVGIWDSLSGEEIRRLETFDNSTMGVAWSLDGRQLAISSLDGQVQIFGEDGSTFFAVDAHPHEVWGATWSPDGTRLATAGHDQTARVWDAVTGESLVTLNGHMDRVYLGVWSPDGELLATVSRDMTARIWEVATGRELKRLEGHEETLIDAAWSPDGRRLATASLDHTARIWDLDSGKTLATLSGHGGRVWGISFHPEGELLATASFDHSARIWDSRSGRELALLEAHDEPLLAVAWSPDGERLATSSEDRTIKIWQVAADRSTTLVSTLRGHGGEVWDVIWSPDGSHLASASKDRTVKLWEAASGRAVRTFAGHAETVYRVDFDAEGRWLASASGDGTVKAWEAFAGHRDTIQGLAWSPDGTHLATGSDDKLARIWDAQSGEELLTLSGHHGVVRGLDWSPSGEYIATASDAGAVWIWRAASGELHKTVGDLGFAATVARWSPGGDRLAIAGGHRAQVWDAEGDHLLFDIPEQSETVWALVWDPQGGRLATAGGDKMVKVWNPADSSLVAALRGHTEEVYDVDWSPDSRYLVSAGRDSTIRLWEVDTGKLLKVLHGHGSSIVSLRFDTDGQRLASASLDGSVRIWDVTSWQETQVFGEHRSGAWSVRWSPDDRFLATTSGTGALQIFGLTMDDLVDQARRKVVRSLTAAECRTYLHQTPCPATSRALAHLVTARDLAAVGRLDDAAIRLRQAQELDGELALDPENQASAWYINSLLAQGRRRLRGGDEEGAVRSLERAQELVRDVSIDFGSERRRVSGQLVELGLLKLDRGQADEAMAAFEKAVAVDAENALALQHLGRLAKLTGDPERGVEALEKARRIGPLIFWARGDLADALRLTGNAAEARRVIEETLTDYPDYSYGRFLLGRLLLEQGDSDQAFAELARLEEADPHGYAANAGPFFHDELFDYAAAHAAYEKVFDLASDDFAARANLTEACFTTERYDRARELAGQVIDHEGTTPYVRLNMRFFRIASWLIEGDLKGVEREREVLLRELRELPIDHPRAWNYSGTKNFVRQLELIPETKQLILNLIAVLEGESD